MERKACYTIFLSSWFFLSGCTYNPLSNSNDLTGSAGGAVVGGGMGAGTTALLNAPGPVIALAGVSGAGIGYYVTSLRYASGGVIQNGGQVFTVGDYVTIEIPTRALFETNTAEFQPGSEPILNSALTVLQRYPNNNIVISGNTSGFSSARYEQKLSEAQARQVAAYLWANGITTLSEHTVQSDRKLLYVGYGNYFPIANNITTQGISQNSRIQITAFPSYARLNLGKCRVFHNIGGLDKPPLMTQKRPCDINSAFQDDNLPEDHYNSRVPATQLERDYLKENYSNVTSLSQTNEGGSVSKQTGFKGEGGFKDEGSR